MIEFLQEEGYSLDLIHNSKAEYGDVTALRFLNQQSTPFLIVYNNAGPVRMDISTLYETAKEEGDEFCSLFARFPENAVETYSKNLRTNQASRLNLIS